VNEVNLLGFVGKSSHGGISFACRALIAIITAGEIESDGLKQPVQLTKLRNVARASDAVERAAGGEVRGEDDVWFVFSRFTEDSKC